MPGDWKKRGPNLLYEDDQDRLRFLERLEERVHEFAIRLYLLTLMPNHFHLVLEIPRGNLSRFMHSYEREVAAGTNRLLHIGNSSAVSRQLAKLRDRLEADRRLKKGMATAQEELERLRQGISRK